MALAARSARWPRSPRPRASTTCASTCSTACPTSRVGHRCCTRWPARRPVPIVRVPWNEPGIIGRVLDAGALGVIIPMVNTPDEARARRRRLPLRAGGHPQLRPARRRCSATAADYFASAERPGRVHPDDRDAPGGRVASTTSSPCRASTRSTSARPTSRSPTASRPGSTTRRPVHGALATVVAACERHGVVPGIHSQRRAGGHAPRTAASA